MFVCFFIICFSQYFSKVDLHIVLNYLLILILHKTPFMNERKIFLFILIKVISLFLEIIAIVYFIIFNVVILLMIDNSYIYRVYVILIHVFKAIL